MTITQWSTGSPALNIDTPEGLPGEIRSVFRRLQSFGLLDDAFFLRLIANTISLDPMHLCATIQGGHLNDLTGLDTSTLRFIGTTLTIGVYAADRFAGELAICLTSNDVSLLQHKINEDNPENTDIVEISTQPLRSFDLFALIKSTEAKDRIRKLRLIFGALTHAVQTTETVVDPLSIAKNAVDSPG